LPQLIFSAVAMSARHKNAITHVKKQINKICMSKVYQHHPSIFSDFSAALISLRVGLSKYKFLSHPTDAQGIHQNIVVCPQLWQLIMMILTKNEPRPYMNLDSFLLGPN
jgi:hypothetical protein